jgi:hypothetical protein
METKIMKTFDVEIARVETKVKTFRVEAKNDDDAFEKALALAYDFDYSLASYHSSEYECGDIEEIPEDFIKRDKQVLQDKVKKLMSLFEETSQVCIDDQISRVDIFGFSGLSCEIDFTDIDLVIHSCDITDIQFESTFATVTFGGVHYKIQFLCIKNLES